jgi:hypothetical protein
VTVSSASNGAVRARCEAFSVGHEGRLDHYHRFNRAGVGTGRRKEFAVYKVNLMLADAAQVAEGKLNILGGGWSFIAPEGPFAVCGIIDIPWDRATHWHSLRLELIDDDGEPVLIPVEGEQESQPFSFEPPRYRPSIAPYAKPGTSIGWPFALSIGPGLPLEPGRTYEFRLTINGEGEADWTLPFSVFPAPSIPQAA